MPIFQTSTYVQEGIGKNKGFDYARTVNPTRQALEGNVAKSHKLLFVVDNTFATPVFQRPIEHGADIVLHSATKYLNGHSDMVGGIAVMNDDELAAQVQFIQKSVGAVPGPMDAWLAL